MPRRRTNHSDVSATSGANVADEPSSPMPTPCAIANNQTLLDSAAPMKPQLRPAAPIRIGAAGLSCGFIGAALSSNVWLFAIAHGVGIGLLGSSATFAPLVADTSLWFVRRRGIAVAICASGNYVAGAIWPPIVQHFVQTVGWRQTYIGLGVLCALSLPLLALAMRPRPPAASAAPAKARFGTPSDRPFGLSLGGAQTMLCIAGVACCVAMSMPQV